MQGCHPPKINDSIKKKSAVVAYMVLF